MFKVLGSAPKNSMYLCPLSRSSNFSLTKLHLQRNCNATDTDEIICEKASSFSLSLKKDGQLQVPVQSVKVPFGGSGYYSFPKGSDDTCTFNKHVGFSAACKTDDRSRSRSTQQCSNFSFGSSYNISASGSGRGNGTSSTHLRQSIRRSLSTDEGNSPACSMLVPLTRNQSNLYRLADTSTNNAQASASANTKPAASNDANGCEVGTAQSGKNTAGLLATSGVPYWNVYEYQDFREIQNGQGQVFDPQADPRLHREGILLDNYNRLARSFPEFRRPHPMYHVR